MTNSIETSNEFIRRHIGPSDSDIQTMLKTLGFSSLDEMTNQVIPKNIKTSHKYDLGQGKSEYETLNELKNIISQNQNFKSYIGMGYNNAITPAVILRNVLENPGWYTAYTPYQPEISQGRLEALLNFQTMVKEITSMEIANASLLDEGTAAAEAMVMCHSLCKAKNVDHFLASPQLHPQTLEILKTRSEAIGLKMIIEEPNKYDHKTPVFAVFIQYPTTDGSINDYSDLSQKVHQHGAMLAVAADILSLALLTPPGEWGADIVFGNTQRFGIPMGFGGPHAAYFATKDTFKRSMPGRIIGVSIDSQNKPAMRLALQTREQHIRREKATSNICTAQVLLANMAGMFATYHGPEGIKKIASRVHKYTQILNEGLKKLGYTNTTTQYFDTLKVTVNDKTKIIDQSQKSKINFRIYNENAIGISLDETTTLEDIQNIWSVFNMGKPVSFKANELENSVKTSIPEKLQRKSPLLTHPIFSQHHSETEMMRYLTYLQNKDISLIHSMIPLGSCTMKLNAAAELIPVSWPELANMHPFVPQDQAKGTLQMIHELEKMLCEVTGFAGVSLQPNAGSQGEYAGLLVIRKYHHSKGQIHRNVCLIPSSAHGTNPASAVMAGFNVVVVACDTQGNVDLQDLKKKAQEHKDNLACLMITYPSTHGVFEEAIKEICQTIHENGGQVYMDGANMNAQVGLTRPGEFGPDVCHLNLHKTFAIPHGGGGPGVGPIGVAAHLKEYLPTHSVIACGTKNGISAISAAPYGSASVLPISWVYLKMMGAEGLKKATQMAILNANYIAKKLDHAFPVLYKGKEGLVAHECILDLRPLKNTTHIEVNDVAKRLMDFGFHAPTMSFPVVGTLMVEPTESEPKAELDRFIEAMLKIHEEMLMVGNGKYDAKDNPLVNAPHTATEVCSDNWKHSYSRETAAFPLPWLKVNKVWPASGRVDNAYGDKNLVCTCPPIEAYK